jgi:hypothetical protein
MRQLCAAILIRARSGQIDSGRSRRTQKNSAQKHFRRSRGGGITFMAGEMILTS